LSIAFEEMAGTDAILYLTWRDALDGRGPQFQHRARNEEFPALRNHVDDNTASEL
jgi:hypothetical protein